MTRTSIGVRALSVVAIAALTLVAGASAALPKPKQALVVPFQSIGPIKFGTSKSKAFHDWGSGDCAVGTRGRTTCTWLSSSPTDFPEEGTILELSGGKVCGMEMRAGSNVAGDSLTITKLKKWKTKEGVGLGSKLKAAEAVLGGKPIVTRHHVTTLVEGGFLPSTEKKVEEIQIFKKGCAVT